MTANRDYAEENKSVQPLEFPVYTTPMPLQIHHVTLTLGRGLDWDVKCQHEKVGSPHFCDHYMFFEDGSEWMEWSHGDVPQFPINGPFAVRSWWEGSEDPEWFWRLATEEELATVAHQPLTAPEEA